MQSAAIAASSSNAASGASSSNVADIKEYVVDRHGNKIAPQFDQITERIRLLCKMGKDPLDRIDASAVMGVVSKNFRSGMTTREIDELIVLECASRASDSDQWLKLAGRLCLGDLHKRTPAGLTQMIAAFEADPGGRARVISRLSDEYRGIVKRFGAEIDARIKPERDFDFRIFGAQTIIRSYLLRAGGRSAGRSAVFSDELVERPGHMYMRVALALHCSQPGGQGHLAEDGVARARLARALDYYDDLSRHEVSHASPTLLNAGTKRQQMASCFQLATGDDMGQLMRTYAHAGLTSKWAGGMSLGLSGLRAEGSHIAGTGGSSSGIKNYMRMCDELIMYADQGGNRPGAMAIYLGVWHADVFTFLQKARPHEPRSVRQLKTALMVPNLFVTAVVEDGDWWLMSPDKAKDLHLTHGPAFEKLYRAYIAEGKFARKVKARAVFLEIQKTVQTVGHPYVLLLDHINANSNLQNVGPICTSNLCAEITIPAFSDFDAEAFGRPAGEGEYGVCNLGAVCLDSFVVSCAAARSSGAGPFDSDLKAAGIDVKKTSADAKTTSTDAKTTSTDAKTTNVDVKTTPAEKKDSQPAYMTELRTTLFSSPLSVERLAAHMRKTGVTLDFPRIVRRAYSLARALDHLIDISYSPTSEEGAARDPGARSNRRHRPIAIGIMGLADVFARLGLVFGSPEALALDRAIAAAIYLGATLASSHMGEAAGCFPSFLEKGGCPASRGELQPDIWSKNHGAAAPSWEDELDHVLGCADFGAAAPKPVWEYLRGRLKKGWLRNSYVTAYMPTATTSNIVGMNECFEPFTYNIYQRKTLAGQHTIINRHLEDALHPLGLWTPEMQNRIIAANGSIQGIDDIPLLVRRMFRTAREIDPRLLMLHAYARVLFISQSMSLNGYDVAPTSASLLERLCSAVILGLPIAWYYIGSESAKETDEVAPVPDEAATRPDKVLSISAATRPDKVSSISAKTPQLNKDFDESASAMWNAPEKCAADCSSCAL